MKHLKKYKKFYESAFSSLLDLSDNVDYHLIYQIKKNVKPEGKILEISCGNGSDSLHLQELGFKVTCTELNPEYVKNAKELGLDCIQHNSKDKFPFPDNEFDLIYSRLGLHYFTEDELNNIFSELKRIGNNILITVKVVDDIKTGKVILTPEKWNEIVSNFFDIKTFEIKEGKLYGSQSKWIEIEGVRLEKKSESKNNKIFEAIETDLEDISDIMNDIPDYEDGVEIYIKEDSERIKINIFPEKGGFFKVNKNIKSVIQRLNYLYKNEYTFLYQYNDGRKWIKFYVYDDERGLRDFNTIRLDGSGKFEAPEIFKMQIVMIK